MRKFIFTHLVAQMPYPATVKGKLTALHSTVVTKVAESFRNTKSFKTSVVDVINVLSYCVVTNADVDSVWSADAPVLLRDTSWIDKDEMQTVLGSLYIGYDEISWDVKEVLDTQPSAAAESKPFQRILPPAPPAVKASVVVPPANSIEPTPKSHLYLGAATFPQFDITKPWLQANIGGEVFAIYTSLPEIPTNQSEITITTDASRLTASDRFKLFPNRVIHTRPSCMYEPVPGIELDPTLGLILPIEGFTAKQIKANIIEYPHFHNLIRIVDDQPQPFHAAMEVDGELIDLSTRESWVSSKCLSKLPFSVDVLKEYVIRRYLLERDIKHIEHKYPMFGTLDKFLTLFMPAEMYKQYKYDPDSVAKSCVAARISYFQSRNPMLRRVLAYQT